MRSNHLPPYTNKHTLGRAAAATWIKAVLCIIRTYQAVGSQTHIFAKIQAASLWVKSFPFEFTLSTAFPPLSPLHGKSVRLGQSWQNSSRWPMATEKQGTKIVWSLNFLLLHFCHVFCPATCLHQIMFKNSDKLIFFPFKPKFLNSADNEYVCSFFAVSACNFNCYVVLCIFWLFRM